jgi:CHASE2 domain-containing sensor protein
MLMTAIFLFIIALCFGIGLLVTVLSDRPTSKPVILIHGGAALIGLLLIITYMLKGHFEPLLVASIVLFIIAALGGLTLFSFDLRAKPIPKALTVLHPLLAFTAFLILIIYILP